MAMRQDRLVRIYEIIRDEGRVSVTALSQRFGVSGMTIRRDLQQLDAQGLVQRIHGGALLHGLQRDGIEPPVLERVEEQAAEKRRIALAAAELIHNGETVFIGSGTTTLALARVLASRRTKLTVITNALTVANTLAAMPEVTLIVLGGFLRRSELSLVGHFTENATRDLRVDKVIIGMRGIDIEHGLTGDHLQELKTDQAIIGMSNTVIILADHTKFGRVAASRTASVSAASLIVTDTAAPAEIVQALQRMGVTVIQV